MKRRRRRWNRGLSAKRVLRGKGIEGVRGSCMGRGGGVSKVVRGSRGKHQKDELGAEDHGGEGIVGERIKGKGD